MKEEERKKTSYKMYNLETLKGKKREYKLNIYNQNSKNIIPLS